MAKKSETLTIKVKLDTSELEEQVIRMADALGLTIVRPDSKPNSRDIVRAMDRANKEPRA